MSMENKHTRLIKDTLIFSIGNLGSKIILFFLVRFYTDYLTKEEYGISDLVFTVAQLAIPFLSFVIHDAVLRYGLSKEYKKENVLLNSHIVLLVGSFIALIITPVLGFYVPLSKWKWYLASYIIIDMFAMTEMSYLKVKEKNKIYAFISIIQTSVMALLNIVLIAYFKLGIKGYLLSTIISTLCVVILCLSVGGITKDLKEGSKDNGLLMKMLKYSAPLILNNISWWIIQSSDKMMIEYIISASALGLYTVATKIPSLINVIISIFSQAWGVSSVKEIESDKDKSFYKDVFENYSFIAFAAAVFLISITKIFMYFYVSNEYFISWKYVPMLLASASFSAVASYFGSMYGALKLSTRNMLTTITAAIVNIVFNIILIPKIGVLGAVISTLLSYIVIALYRMFEILSFIDFKPNLIRFFLNCFIVVVLSIVVSLDFYIYISSLIFILIFVFVNYENIKNILGLLLRIRKRQ